MNNNKQTFCEISYIYSLVFNNMPVYIGKTNNPKRRISQHRNGFNLDMNKYLYIYLRKLTNRFEDIKMRIIKISNKHNEDFLEMKFIKKCLDKKQFLFNNCVKTQSYCVSKYKVTIEEYNNLILKNKINENEH